MSILQLRHINSPGLVIIKTKIIDHFNYILMVLYLFLFFFKAQSHLGQKRVKAQDVQGFLEAKMKEYQECLVHVQNLDRAMKVKKSFYPRSKHKVTTKVKKNV